MAFKPIHPIEAVNGYTVKGWYNSFITATPEESKQALVEAWTSPAQRRFNATHKTCPRCNGRGYTRKDGNIGCSVCLGTASLPISEEK